MKKLNAALVLSTVLMSISAQAQWEGNWLFGVSAGSARHEHKDDITLTFTGGGLFSSFDIDNESDEVNFFGGVLAGYQAICHDWLLGFEVNVDWRGVDDDISFNVLDPTIGLTAIAGTISQERDYVVGLTARLGYNVLPCLTPYIRFGVNFSERDLDLNAIQPLPLTITWIKEDDDIGRWGFVGGIGLEWVMPMMISLSLRVEWDYHRRGDQHEEIIALGSNDTALITVSGLEDRHEQTVIASLVYNFCI